MSHFGPFVLDVERRVLSADGVPLHVGPRAVAALSALVERRGEVVTKTELLDRVWPGEDVNESNVTQAIYLLRKELRARGYASAIVTVPWRGYRFDAQAAPATNPVVVEASVDAPRPSGRHRWFAPLVALAAAAVVVWLPSAAGWSGPHPRPAGQLSTRGAELYKLGRYHWNLRTASDLASAAVLFSDVIRTDPKNPAGYVGLADTDLMIADYHPTSSHPRILWASARRCIAIALAIAPDDAPAHVSRAMLLYSADHRASVADSEFQRAIALDPTYATAHHWYGATLIERGRIDAGMRELREALRLDPLSPATGAWLGSTAYSQRHFADAIRYERIAIDLRPTEYNQLRTLGLAYEMSGNLRVAAATFEHLASAMRVAHADDVNVAALLSEVYAREGRRAEAQANLRTALHDGPRDGDTAFALIATGQRAPGLRILAYAARDAGDPLFANDPRLDPVRADLPKQQHSAML